MGFYVKYKAGLIDEMLQDTMEAMDDDEIEEEAEEEVNKVLFSITNGKRYGLCLTILFACVKVHCTQLIL